MGISGFEPSFLVGLDAVRQAHGSRLAGLIGRRLTRFALVRFAEDGDWFADCPVVLDFDGVQAEVCHWKLDELSIGWDTIDTTASIAGWDWFELTPQWSRNDERLESFLGQELGEVALLEWRPSDRDLAAGTVAVVRLRQRLPADRQRPRREPHRGRRPTRTTSDTGWTGEYYRSAGSG
ncbi:hypothetical protein ACGFIW_19270 [Micromonospora sp. NPDC048935]|uniref:hypothetical protein n=1 Tax=Micromonospora sp. NPDC048935 TaxID=3364262 RepID=UPI00371D1E17